MARKPLLFAEIWSPSVDSDERVFVARNCLKPIGLHLVIALYDGNTVYISGHDTPVSTRFLLAFAQFSLLISFVHGPSPSKPQCSPARNR